MFTKPRKDFAAWIRQQLIGPANDEPADGFPFNPTDRYPCGALYPVSAVTGGWDADVNSLETDILKASGSLADGVEPPTVRRYVPPSSCGFSFFVEGDAIELDVIVSGRRYATEVRGEGGKFERLSWKRFEITEVDGEYLLIRGPSVGEPTRFPVFGSGDGALGFVDAEWRPHGDGWIVTLTLCNAQEILEDQQNQGGANSYNTEHASRTIFGAELRCVIQSGEVGTYPRTPMSLLDDEEQELEVQYSSRKIYAVGHGMGVDWQIESDGRPPEIWTDALPSVEVPQVTADSGANDIPALNILHLTNLIVDDNVMIDLSSFVDGYGAWILKQVANAESEEEEWRLPSQRIVNRMHEAERRMRRGLAILSANEKVQEAFVLANLSMLNQMEQSDAIRRKPRSREKYTWRPFQLAFLLAVLSSACDEDDEFRDTVDLIWFPTGGGKTEAYLALMAFQITFRRLTYPSAGGGTSVLMRYTMQLLARDQFIRASRLICALELIRRGNDELGDEPITIGFWAGADVSPNTYRKAVEQIENAHENQSVPNFVLTNCPWCGHKFGNQSFEYGDDRFHFRCRNRDCDFGNARIPANVVDQALYDSPPTLLVGTLDKFATFAWHTESSSLFGGDRHRPPELIIQDELHLIAGSLGSIAGLYEAGLDTVINLRGVRPKYVASTATIRQAAEQVRKLYGREVAIFPPPGLSCDDSYYARTVPLTVRPGRLYVGYLAPMLNRAKCLGPIGAAVLNGPVTLFENEDDAEVLLDAWWSSVMYHGSLAGVGRSHTVLDGRVRDFGQQMFLADPRSSRNLNIKELTSLQSAEKNGEVFANLARGVGSNLCIDVALATNMVSVGLDVARLALMVVNGQPMSSAEYIQASSRVGRSDVPGLVITNFYRDQTRSLSHYEGFRPYHEAFYKYVEPTSVTPFTFQARQRALHACLVIVIRHSGIGMLPNESAGRFDSDDPRIRASISRLRSRCKSADPALYDEIAQHLEELVDQWQSEVDRSRENERQLWYAVKDNDMIANRLIHDFDAENKGLWPTLRSMRNVENSAVLDVCR